MFIVTQMLQFILGFDPLEAGIGLLPVAIMFMVFAPVAPRIVERFGSKRLVGFGLVGGACGLLVLATVQADSSYVHIALGLVCMSGGMSMAMPSATESIMGSVPKEKAGVGSAMNDTTRQAGGALGVAVLGSVLASGFTSELSRRLASLKVGAAGIAQSKQSIGAAINYADHLGGKAGATLATVARESWMHGASLALLIGSVFVFGGAALAFALLPRASRRTITSTRPKCSPSRSSSTTTNSTTRTRRRWRRARSLLRGSSPPLCAPCRWGRPGSGSGRGWGPTSCRTAPRSPRR